MIRRMGSEAVLTWRVPSLPEAGGFVFYVVDFDPPRSVGKKRQSAGVLCPPPSPCRVPVQLGGVTASGLDPDVMYTISVVAENEDREKGETVTQTCKCTYPPS